MYDDACCRTLSGMTTPPTPPPTTPPITPPPITPPPAPPSGEEPIPGTTASARLERPAGHPWRGVARALAKATGTDVILWRVLFIVLVFFDGLGIVLYLAGLLAIPQQGQPRSLADRLLHGPNRRLANWDLALVVVLVVATLALLADGDGLIAVAVIGVVAFLVLREPSPAGYVVSAPTTPEVEPPAYAPAADPFVVPPPRPRSILGRLTVSVALLVVSLELLAAAAGNEAITERVVIASALVVVGLGLVVGSWWGRSALLVVLAVLLSLALFVTTAVDGVLGKGVGERSWRPVAAGSYELGIGEAVLDLRDPALADAEGVLSAKVGIGHLVVLAPSDTDRSIPGVLSRIGRGGCSVRNVTIEGDRLEDIGPFPFTSRRQESGGVNRELSLTLPELPALTVDLEVGIGEIEVCHV